MIRLFSIIYAEKLPCGRAVSVSVIVFVVQAVAVVRIMSKSVVSTFVLIQLTGIDDKVSLSSNLTLF